MPPFLGEVYPSCWGLVRAWYPGTPECAHLSADLFSPVVEPQDGDLVMMRNGAHCGIWWRGGILHQASLTNGVIYDKSAGAAARAEFYRRRSAGDRGRPQAAAS